MSGSRPRAQIFPSYVLLQRYSIGTEVHNVADHASSDTDSQRYENLQRRVLQYVSSMMMCSSKKRLRGEISDGLAPK